MPKEIYDFIHEQCRAHSKMNLSQVSTNINKIIKMTANKFNISEEEANSYYIEFSKY